MNSLEFANAIRDLLDLDPIPASGGFGPFKRKILMAAQPSNPNPARMSPRRRQGSLIRWVYMDRYEVHTHTREEAIRTLKQHGFRIIDESQLIYGRVTRPTPMSTDFEKEGTK